MQDADKKLKIEVKRALVGSRVEGIINGEDERYLQVLLSDNSLGTIDKKHCFKDLEQGDKHSFYVNRYSSSKDKFRLLFWDEIERLGAKVQQGDLFYLKRHLLNRKMNTSEWIHPSGLLANIEHALEERSGVFMLQSLEITDDRFFWVLEPLYFGDIKVNLKNIRELPRFCCDLV